MMPYVILHNAISADGRFDHFIPDIGLFYELAARWKEDATLVGVDTFLQAAEPVPAEDDSAFLAPIFDASDSHPLLVVADSRGRLRSWHYWRQQPYWRNWISLGSKLTPGDHLEYLRKRHIQSIIAGDDHVDFRRAFEVLNRDHGVKMIRVDSGGTLNGVLLRAGLVNEVSLMVHPTLVGGLSPKSLFRAPDLTSAEGVIPLKLQHVEQLRGDAVWLVYSVED